MDAFLAGFTLIARVVTVFLCVAFLLGLLLRWLHRRGLRLPWLQTDSTDAVPVGEWFHVTMDGEGVRMQARPPGRKAWEESLAWGEITRVCFKSEGPCDSDGIYLFTTRRPESYAVPLEAAGGAELWSELVRRELFPAELAITAASLPAGELRCWPALPGDRSACRDPA